MCPLTSLLVLETERDYARFGIERTALADVMVVGKSGIELRKRAPDDVPAPVAILSAKPRAATKSLDAGNDKSKDAKGAKEEEAIDALHGRAQAGAATGGGRKRGRGFQSR